jgi:hypothetical protein
MPISSASQHPIVVLLICCVAAIGGFLFGFDSGVINGTVDGLQQAFQSESVGTGFNVASMLLGCAVGAFFAGRLADKFGRRTLLLVAAVFFIVSAWGSGIADGSFEFVIYRILGGLAVGAASVMSPAYISEIAPSHLRGRLATIQQVAIIGGLFFSFLNNYILANVAGGSTAPLWFGFEAWRCMFWMELIPAGIFLIALLFIPESPRFLVSAGHDDKAERVLRLVYSQAPGRHPHVTVEPSQASPVGSDQPRYRQIAETGLDRHRSGRVPAVGRDQRGVLLRRRAVAGSRFLRERRIDDQRHQRRRQHRGLSGHDRPDRPHRSQTAAVGRFRRDDDHPGDSGLCVLHRRYRQWQSGALLR